MDGKFKRLHIDEKIELIPICFGVDNFVEKKLDYVIKYGKFRSSETTLRSLFAVYYKGTLEAYYFSDNGVSDHQALTAAMKEFNCKYFLPILDDGFNVRLDIFDILLKKLNGEKLDKKEEETIKDFNLETAYAPLIMDRLNQGKVDKKEITQELLKKAFGLMQEKNDEIYLYGIDKQNVSFEVPLADIKKNIVKSNNNNSVSNSNANIFFDLILLTAFSGCIVNRLQLNPVILGVLSNKRANAVLGYLYAGLNGNDALVRISDKAALLKVIKGYNKAFRVESGRKTANLTAAIDEMRVALNDNCIMIFDAQHLFPLDTGDCSVMKYTLLFDQLEEFESADEYNLYDYISTNHYDYVGEFKNYIYTIDGTDMQSEFKKQVVTNKDTKDIKQFKSIYEERIKLFKYTADILDKKFGYKADIDAVIQLLNDNTKGSHGGTQLICDDILEEIIYIIKECPEIIAGIEEGKVYIKYKNISDILKSQYNGYSIVDVLDVLNEGKYIYSPNRKRKDGGLRYQKRYEEQETLCLQNVPDKSLDEITKKYDEYKNKKGKSNGEK